MPAATGGVAADLAANLLLLLLLLLAAQLLVLCLQLSYPLEELVGSEVDRGTGGEGDRKAGVQGDISTVGQERTASRQADSRAGWDHSTSNRKERGERILKL